jgi:glycosyltransferase involved in cell wall biosynthesis
MRRDRENLLQLASVVAAPSRYESSGLVVLEAMMAERPVVASDLAVLREAVDDGKTGILVPLTPDRLSAALVGLLGDRDRRRTMGKLAGIRARGCFGADRMAADYAALYQRTAEERR